MVRRYAHFSAEHLAPYADRLCAEGDGLPQDPGYPEYRPVNLPFLTYSQTKTNIAVNQRLSIGRRKKAHFQRMPPSVAASVHPVERAGAVSIPALLEMGGPKLVAGNPPLCT
jgi:hypothetical protein